MKRFLLSILTVLATASSFAQITITDADYPSLNDSIIFGADTNAAINVAGKGLQSWDFSTLQNDAIDTLIFIDPATTTFASSFSMTDIAVEEQNQTNYYTKTTNVFETNGFAGDPLGINADQAFPFDNPQALMIFPASYTSLMSDTSSAEIKMNAKPYTSNAVDSVWIKHTVYASSEIDGYGNLTLPNGQTYNTLKQSSTAITIDSIWIYVSNAMTAAFIGVPANQWAFSPPVAGVISENPILDTVYSHNWIANGKKYPLVETTVDTLEGTPLLTKYRIERGVGATISATNISCNGMSDGGLVVSPTTGFSPYTYIWSNNETVAMITGLGAGNYTVTVTDMFGDTASSSIQLIDPAIVSANLSITDVTCYGNSDGKVEILNVAGNTPYTFLWSNGATTDLLTGLSKQTLSLSITANGCDGTVSSILVDQPDTLDIQFYGIGEIVGSSNVSVTVSGGTSPYLYLWEGGQTTQNLDSTFACPTGSSANYDVFITVTDINGCIKMDSDSAYCVYTSIEELNQNIKIYPNPTSGKIRLEIHNSSAGNVEVFDALGKMLIKERLDGIKLLDLATYQEGLYYIRIETEQGIITRKITLIK